MSDAPQDVSEEELDLLPQCAIVKDRDGDWWVKIGEADLDAWRMVGGGDGGPIDSDSVRSYAPLTVISNPTPPRVEPTAQGDLVRIAKTASDAFWAETVHTQQLIDAMITLRAELSTLED